MNLITLCACFTGAKARFLLKCNMPLEPRQQPELTMQKKTMLDEQAMLAAEARIPKLATQAVQDAYARALLTSGKVLEAIDGNLVETDCHGGQRIVRALHSPISIAVGTKKRIKRMSA